MTEPTDIIEFIHDADKVESVKETYFHSAKEEKKEILAALKDIKSEGVGNFLNALLPGEPDRELQKAIKKALFRLKTMGIKVEEPRAGGEPVLRKIEEKRDYRGFMSNYDQEGTRVVVAALEVKHHNYIFVNGITHWSDGLTDLKLAPVTRQGLDAIITQYRKDTSKSIIFVDISPRYAAYLIEEADSRSHRYTGDVSQFRQFSHTLKDPIAEPKDIYGLEVPAGTLPVPGADVLLHEIFDPFPFTWETIEKDMAAFADISSPSIVLPPHMVEEKREAFIRSLLETDALKSKFPLVKRMLEDYTYAFHTMGLFDHYLALKGLLEIEKGLDVALTFFAVKVLAKAIKTPEPREPGLIISPYEQIRR